MGKNPVGMKGFLKPKFMLFLPAKWRSTQKSRRDDRIIETKIMLFLPYKWCSRHKSKTLKG
jgi:hypothetical protein